MKVSHPPSSAARGSLSPLRPYAVLTPTRAQRASASDPRRRAQRASRPSNPHYFAAPQHVPPQHKKRRNQSIVQLHCDGRCVLLRSNQRASGIQREDRAKRGCPVRGHASARRLWRRNDTRCESCTQSATAIRRALPRGSSRGLQGVRKPVKLAARAPRPGDWVPLPRIRRSARRCLGRLR